MSELYTTYMYHFFFFEFCRQIIKEMRQFLFVNNQEAKEEEEKKDMT